MHRGATWDWTQPRVLGMLSRAALRGEVLAFVLAGARSLPARGAEAVRRLMRLAASAAVPLLLVLTPGTLPQPPPSSAWSCWTSLCCFGGGRPDILQVIARGLDAEDLHFLDRGCAGACCARGGHARPGRAEALPPRLARYLAACVRGRLAADAAAQWMGHLLPACPS